MFTRAFLCLSLFTGTCLLITHVYSRFPMLTRGDLCLPLFTGACLPILCLPMFTHEYSC